MKKKNLVPLDIVYEPPKSTKTPIYCFFAPKIYMAYAKFNSVLIARIFFENLKKPSQNTSGVVLASLAILMNLTIL